MSYWKKAISIVLIFNIVFFSLPVTIWAQQTITTPTPTYTLPKICGVGQTMNSAGNCVAVTIPSQTIGSPNSGPCKGLTGNNLNQCEDAQAAKSTLQTFNPSVNLSSGNTYGGISISGIGGAIASCTNIGSFLANTASNLLAKTSVKIVGKSLSSYLGLGGGAVQTSDSKATAQLTAMNKTSQCLNGIAYAVAKNTLAQITNKTLNWVNTGFNGNPLYVQNVGSYLNSIKNQQIASYLNTVQGTDPIFGNALRSAMTYQITGRSDGLLNTPLNTPQSQAYNSFISDFTNGGWDALLNPAYNPVGAFFNASDKLGNNITQSQQNASNEIQRNSGFLDLKKCTQTTTPAATSNTTTAISAGLNNNNTINGLQNCSTVTPGSVIASQVNTITTSPNRQLEQANQINEVLGSFFDSLVNNLLSKGLRGSSSGSTPIAGLGSSGDNSVSGNLSSSDASALGYASDSTGGINTGDFDISRPQQLYAIIQTQYNFLNASKDAQIAEQRIIPAIGALDYCIPGPNPDWQTNLDSNWQTFVGSIQQAPPKDVSTAEKLLGDIPFVGSLLSGIVGIFTDSGKAPSLWGATGVFSDKITGQSIQLQRTFYTPKSHDDGVAVPDIQGALGLAYQAVVGQYSAFFAGISGTTYQGSLIGSGFQQAAAGDADTSYVDGFLQDAYVNTDSLTGYNQAVASIDQTYDQNISDTQNDVEQLENIREQVDSIVANAKARYIKQRAAAGDPVNMACINQAYQINAGKIVGQAQQEPDDSNALHNEEDLMVQHSADAAQNFYNNDIQ